MVYSNSDITVNIFALVFSIGALVATIFFIIALYKTMKLVKPKNRSCAPGWCWGLIIPLVNVVFTWIIVYAMLPNSLARELSSNKKALERIKHLKHLGRICSP